VPPATPGARAASDRAAHLREQLTALERDQLVDLLVEAAGRDPALARRLSLAAVQAEDDLAALRESIRASFSCPGHLDYWPAIRYAEAAADGADTLAGLVREGRGGDVVPLTELAVGLLLDAVGKADDSAGALGDLMRRLLRMHAEACAAGPVDPVRLAGWLVEFQLGGQDWFTVDVAEYAAALGEAGLAAYRRAVAAAWRARPTDFQVRYAREGLAKLDRDVAALLEVVGGDLRYAAQYGRLARALRDIGERAAAIEWAERGLRAHPEDPPGAGLRDFLVEAYLSRDGGTEAVRLRRDGLARQPVLHSFTALRSAARHAGRWDAERPAALALLAHRNPEDHVRALLAEDDVDGAWTAAQGVPELSGHTWDELARRRARTHPDEVVDIMRRRIDEVLTHTGREVYRDAVRRLHLLRDVCARCGRGADFERCVRSLIERHHRRSVFLAELSRAGLGT
jgi:hypothetical protein